MSDLQHSLAAMLGGGEMIASYATVDANGVDVSGDEVLIEVTCQPSGAPRTVRMAADFVGPSFGVYTLPVDGDELLVVFPQGGGIGVAVARLNNAADKIPDDLRDLADKRPILLVHPGGVKAWITDDQVKLDAGSTPVLVEGSDIKLGDTSAQQLATKAVVDWLESGPGRTFLTTHVHIDPVSGLTGTPDPASIGLLTGIVNGVTTKTRAS